MMKISRYTHLWLQEDYFPWRASFLLWSLEHSLSHAILGVFRRVDISLTRGQRKIKDSHCFSGGGEWVFEMGKGSTEPPEMSVLDQLCSERIPCQTSNRLSYLLVRADAGRVYTCQREHHLLLRFTHAWFLGWHNSLTQFAEGSIKQDLALMLMF